MAFLDNSGDIILDAVLTDLGRKRMAEGKFNITQFALGDEEINYRLYNINHEDGPGSADLEILQTPLLEAFTNNESLMKSRLISYANDTLLYMPVMKVNNKVDGVKPSSINEGFVLLADRTTIKSNEGQRAEDGFLPGTYPYRDEDTNRFSTKCINIDTGIDSTEHLTVLSELDPVLHEVSWLVRVDDRLIQIQVPSTINNHNSFGESLRFQNIDDDFVASYYMVRGLQGAPVISAWNAQFRARGLINDQNIERTDEIKEFEMFAGPLGPVMQFVPRVRDEIQFSDSWFDKLGSTGSNLTYRGQNISSYKYIDTNINVQGMTTGFSLDIPIRIVKKS
jgi:hypothetical protein